MNADESKQALIGVDLARLHDEATIFAVRRGKIIDAFGLPHLNLAELPTDTNYTHAREQLRHHFRRLGLPPLFDDRLHPRRVHRERMRRRRAQKRRRGF